MHCGKRTLRCGGVENCTHSKNHWFGSEGGVMQEVFETLGL